MHCRPAKKQHSTSFLFLYKTEPKNIFRRTYSFIYRFIQSCPKAKYISWLTNFVMSFIIVACIIFKPQCHSCWCLFCHLHDPFGFPADPLLLLHCLFQYYLLFFHREGTKVFHEIIIMLTRPIKASVFHLVLPNFPQGTALLWRTPKAATLPRWRGWTRQRTWWTKRRWHWIQFWLRTEMPFPIWIFFAWCKNLLISWRIRRRL